MKVTLHYPQQQNHSNPNQISSKKISNFWHTNTISNPSDWSFIIRKHITQGSQREALVLYNQIRCKGAYILGLVPLILKACACVSDLTYGKSLHSEAIKKGGDFDIVIGTSLIDMYAKCGDIFYSRKMFDYMPERNVVTWNAMISGYVRNRDMKSALGLFEKMSIRTMVTWIEMIDGFARNGDLVTARCLFDQVPLEQKNVVTWTVMVDGYASKGKMADARILFEEMPDRNYFVWSSMISGYCKLGDVKEARCIFDRIPIRNLVNWNSLICGYAQNGFCEEALEAFENMQADGFEPDEITVVGVLSACAQLGLLDVGKDVHRMAYNKGIKLNQFIMNALVDMYAKCGDLTTARSIFEGMTYKNNACWNAMISGFAIHGQCKKALEFFRRMEESNEKPDDITFLSVLSACAHGGFMDEGLEIFSKMEKYQLAASIKHYGCVVDLLGRAGRLQDAYNLIKRMPMKPNNAVWGALLGACHVHSDMDMAEQVMEEVSRRDCSMDSGNDLHHVLLSNIYAASDSWEKAERTRIVMVNKGLQKIPGCSSVVPANAER
ncbi:pentatricopeptide repeat-containing protein At3g21470 isoform X1 [Ricinus communis]|uniref:pentatricopeptide repeat-containing protein At3g21470 isoform X1 n=1 Tax=Ricinus communis TaxID=3988 RepID=UPI00201B146C|nr:pentatricopeptide repeat-containing protein At3g21470 isoform X1 [Ricinus communis]